MDSRSLNFGATTFIVNYLQNLFQFGYIISWISRQTTGGIWFTNEPWTFQCQAHTGRESQRQKTQSQTPRDKIQCTSCYRALDSHLGCLKELCRLDDLHQTDLCFILQKAEKPRMKAPKGRVPFPEFLPPGPLCTWMGKQGLLRVKFI